MKPASFVFSVFFTLIISSSGLESLYNPQSPVSCGQSDDCEVHCNGSYVCRRFDFYFYDHNVKLICDGLDSCDSAEIHIINTTEVTLHFNGKNSFEAGVLWANTNGSVHTICNYTESCARSSFYYHGIHSGIIHECNGHKACYWGMISAIPNQNTFTLNSSVPSGLQQQNIYLPNLGPSYLNLDSTLGSVYFYSLYGTTNINPTCMSGASDCDSGYTLLYTKEYNEFCPLFNCTDADIPLSEYSHFDMVYITDTNRFDYNLSYLNYSANGRDLLLFLTRPETMHPSLLPPLYSSSDNEFIAVCVQASWTNGCRGRTFDLRSALDATIVHNTKDLIIYGPKNRFQMFAHTNGGYADYYLNETRSIMVECWGSLGCIAHDSNVYLGNNTNLTIHCGASDCTNAQIFSTLDPLGFALEYLWNIECDVDSSSCINLKINFTEYGYGCDYSATHQCPQYILGTPSPTSHPTESTTAPTRYPSTSPTDASQSPSVNPSVSPSHDPSKAPSDLPTWDTMEPTPQPSPYPSHIETPQPTREDFCDYEGPQEKWEGVAKQGCMYCMCDGRFRTWICDKTVDFVNSECRTDECHTLTDSFANQCFHNRYNTEDCPFIEIKEEESFECNCNGFQCGETDSANALKWLFVSLVAMLFVFFV